MKIKGSNDDFIKRVKEELDATEENLDSGIKSRLSRIRYQVLESQKESHWFQKWFLKPKMVFASIVILILAGVLLIKSPTSVNVDFEDVDLLTSTDQLELYEDMDFYVWLELEGVDAG